MNIYHCWYQGMRGYSCRMRNNRWMFVPDMGQPDTRSHRNLELTDLDFTNEFEKKRELDYEASRARYPARNFIRSITGWKRQPVTVFGQLLLPH